MYNSYFLNYMTSPVKQEVIQVDGKPGVMAAIYDFLHEKHIEKAANVRVLINMFR